MKKDPEKLNSDLLYFTGRARISDGRICGIEDRGMKSKTPPFVRTFIQVRIGDAGKDLKRNTSAGSSSIWFYGKNRLNPWR